MSEIIIREIRSLTKHNKQKIREAFADGRGQTLDYLANKYGVSVTAILAVVSELY